MAETIKGINVVIGAETTGLSAALSDVNKRARDIQSELKQVEKLLKLDPTNTELLAQKQKLLADAVANTREKLDRLKSVQEQVNEQFARGEISEGQYRAFQREVVKTEQELRNLEKQLSEVTSEVQDQGKQVSKLGKDYQEAFEEAKRSLGNTYEQAKKLGAAVMAAGVGIAAGLGVAVKGAADFEQAMANAYSVMAPDEVAQFRGELQQLALTMGAQTKYSATEAARGIEELVKAGVSVSDILNGALAGALSLATAGELELADAAEIASTALNAFREDGISVQRAADILAGAANASATSVQELKFGLSQVSAVASAVGLSFEDTATALAVFAQNGLKGSDAGTSLKTMLMRLQPDTKEAKAAFEDLGLFVYETEKAFNWLAEKGITTASTSLSDIRKAIGDYIEQSGIAKRGTSAFSKAFEEIEESIGYVRSAFVDANGQFVDMATMADILRNSMANLTDAQRLQYLQTIFGSDAVRAANILYKEGAQGINAMAAAMGKISAADVAAQKMDTFKGALEELSGSLETAQISIGNALIPALRKLTGIIQSVVDGFNSLPAGVQSTVAMIGALVGVLALVTGPALLLIGFLPQIAAGLSMIGTAVTAVGTALTALSGPIGWAIAAIAGLTAGGIALYRHLSEESIPEIERFGDEVSESTQQAVGAFMDLNDQATVALNQLAWSGQTVTQEMADSIVGTIQQMGNQVLSAMNEQHAEELASMQAFFANAKGITDAEQAEILANVQKGQDQQRAAVEEGQARIAEILNRAAAEKRAITQEEAVEINRIRQQMLETGIAMMSENELEQMAILERMRANAADLSARQAAEVVQNSLRQRDETIAAAEAQYNDVVKAIIRQRDELGTITAEQAEKLIAEAKRQRDEAIARAQEMHQAVVAEAQAQAGEHVNHVDWETGEIKSRWEVLRDSVADRLKQMRDDAKKWFAEKGAAIKDGMSEIRSQIEEKWNEIMNWLRNLPARMREIGRNIIDGLTEGIRSAAQRVRDAVQNIANDISSGVKNFFGINSPSRLMMGFGENIGEGLAIGIRNSIASVKQQVAELNAAASGARAATMSAGSSSSAGGAPAPTRPGTIIQNVTIQAPTPLTPAETARQLQRTSRLLAMEWGLA